MYNTSYFKEKDEQVLLDFVTDHPLAFLTGSRLDGSQVATQVPVMVEVRDGKWFLKGHMMRNTDHYKAFEENPQVLALFTGPNCYVSATWYSDSVSGSTWNYMSVHARGKIRFLPDEGLRQLMQELSLKYEEGNTSSPTVFDNLPDTYQNKMLPAISGFEIEVEDLQNVFKLSQNRDEESFLNIITELEKRDRGSVEVAGEMRKRMEGLFNRKDAE